MSTQTLASSIAPLRSPLELGGDDAVMLQVEWSFARRASKCGTDDGPGTLTLEVRRPAHGSIAQNGHATGPGSGSTLVRSVGGVHDRSAVGASDEVARHAVVRLLLASDEGVRPLQLLHAAAESDAAQRGTPASVELIQRHPWVHAIVRIGVKRVLTIALSTGSIAYVRSDVPALAGLRGGTYDRPQVTIGPRIGRLFLEAAG